jgi:hypothetical protein
MVAYKDTEKKAYEQRDFFALILNNFKILPLFLLL